MADRQDVAVVVVMHLTKDDAKRLIHRVSGAGAFVNAARSVLAMIRDPEDPDGEQGFKRLIVHVATNWGRYAPTLAAHVESKVVKTDDGSDESTGLLVIDGESKFTVDDAQRARDEIDGDDVEDAIREALVERSDNGKENVLTRPSGAIKQKVSKELGCSLKTVQRAAMRMRDRSELGVIEGGFPRTTTWTLTEPDDQHGDDESQLGHAPTRECVLTGANNAVEPNQGSDGQNGVPTAVRTAPTRIAEPNPDPQLSSEDTSAASVPTGGLVPTVNGRNA
jgi:hypothetical protein